MLRIIHYAVLGLAICGSSWAGTMQFFVTNQPSAVLATNQSTDTRASGGYIFEYSRDKLFTGGYGLTNPIGRSERVPWPAGVEAQAYTVGPLLGKGASIVIRRADGARFDISSFRIMLLANTGGAGAMLEVMPMIEGEDVFNDPLYFQATGYYGTQFSYSSTTTLFGVTTALTNADTYKMSLYVDFALTAIRLQSGAADSNQAPTMIYLNPAQVPENRGPGEWVGTCTASDVNVGDLALFALVSGTGDTDNASFQISNGVLRTAGPLNYEEGATRSIRVRAEDSGGEALEMPLSVQVLDEDETPRLTAMELMADGRMRLQFPTVTNHIYTVKSGAALDDEFAAVTNVPSMPGGQSLLLPTGEDAMRLWRIETVP